MNFSSYVAKGGKTATVNNPRGTSAITSDRAEDKP